MVTVFISSGVLKISKTPLKDHLIHFGVWDNPKRIKKNL